LILKSTNLKPLFCQIVGIFLSGKYKDKKSTEKAGKFIHRLFEKIFCYNASCKVKATP